VIRFKSLGSGSSGNATVVQGRSGAGATHLLVDCGLGLPQLDKRLAQAGMLAEQIDAIFITHEHGDHIGCAQQLARRERIPIYMSLGTYLAIGEPQLDGLLRLCRDCETIAVGALQVTPFTVPHDAREPLQLTCTDGDARFGILTDLGHASTHVLQQLAGCGSLMLECNHDPQLLAAGAYPPFLKRRIGGAWGHLANEDAAQIARAILPDGLQQVVAAHLSEQNNRPQIVRQVLAQALGCGEADILVADGPNGSAWLTA
jgi:phosphoribosyl 1,2-cyclic phosphodiesterase